MPKRLHFDFKPLAEYNPEPISQNQNDEQYTLCLPFPPLDTTALKKELLGYQNALKNLFDECLKIKQELAQKNDELQILYIARPNEKIYKYMALLHKQPFFFLMLILDHFRNRHPHLGHNI